VKTDIMDVQTIIRTKLVKLENTIGCLEILLACYFIQASMSSLKYGNLKVEQPEYVCDSAQTCEDNGDERGCHKVIFSKNYNKDTPARSDESQVNPHYHEINTRIKIIDIVWVNQELGEMSLFIKLDFFWYDNSLKFFFLGDQSNNDLNETLEKQIWTPVIDYMYLKNKREVFKKLWIQKLKKPERSGEIDILQPLELYEGSENSICLEIYERIDVLCSFDRIKDYPFGDDTCIIDIYLNGKDNNHATFHPVTMNFTGIPVVGRFTVRSWKYEINYILGSSTKQCYELQFSLSSSCSASSW